jgi:hypothetical protein
MGALITSITLQLARAGHPEAMRVADAHYPGWREAYKDKMFTGRWDESHHVFTPDPPAFRDDPDSEEK